MVCGKRVLQKILRNGNGNWLVQHGRSSAHTSLSVPWFMAKKKMALSASLPLFLPLLLLHGIEAQRKGLMETYQNDLCGIMKQEFQMCFHQWQNLWAWYSCGRDMMQDQLLKLLFLIILEVSCKAIL
jgi:hypothetical protein